MKERKCELCIWYGQCGCEEACEYFQPADEEMEEDLLSSEYIADLQYRHSLYMEQVKEQNS